MNAIIIENLRNKTVCCYFNWLNDMVIWEILIILLIAIFIGIWSVIRNSKIWSMINAVGSKQIRNLIISSHKT